MPWSGTLADRFGHRRAIGTGVLIRASGFALFAVAESIPALVVASVLAGLGGSLFHPASYAMYARLAARGQPGADLLAARDAQQPRLRRRARCSAACSGGSASPGCAWRRPALFLTAFLITMVGLPRDPAVDRERTTGRGPLRRGLRGTAASCASASPSPEPGCWSPSSTWWCRCGRAEVLPSTVGLGTVYSVAAIVMVVTMLPLTRAADRWLRPEVALALATLTLGGGLLLLGLWRSPAGLVRRRRRLHPRAGPVPADHELPGLLVRPGGLGRLLLRGPRPGPGRRAASSAASVAASSTVSRSAEASRGSPMRPRWSSPSGASGSLPFWSAGPGPGPSGRAMASGPSRRACARLTRLSP